MFLVGIHDTFADRTGGMFEFACWLEVSFLSGHGNASPARLKLRTLIGAQSPAEAPTPGAIRTQCAPEECAVKIARPLCTWGGRELEGGVGTVACVPTLTRILRTLPLGAKLCKLPLR